MYVPPLHRRTLIRKFNGNAKYPNTEGILDSAISLPIYPALMDEEAEYVVNALSDVIRRC